MGALQLVPKNIKMILCTRKEVTLRAVTIVLAIVPIIFYFFSLKKIKSWRALTNEIFWNPILKS
jgi:hypothetical protein